MAMLGRWLRHWAFVQLNASEPPSYRIILSDASVRDGLRWPPMASDGL
jgi:hypothetical protein